MALPTGLAHNPTSERFGHLVSDWEDTYGQVWAQDYGDPEEEYQALREAVVVLEYSPIRKWFVDGPDAIKVVDSIFSRDVAALPLGRLAYGVIVDDEGFMYEELTVVKYSDERILLMGGRTRHAGPDREGALARDNINRSPRRVRSRVYPGPEQPCIVATAH
jgi:aminomethyltransferase